MPNVHGSDLHMRIARQAYANRRVAHPQMMAAGGAFVYTDVDVV